ncbi:ABC transporter ATP-binding protein [Ktedonosporobacter rubrisoli]|uniref:ABC transporter ATP-binding protein n=1 Tax=Ktedonosporobacter rubrisoli TaxID=2509675 RepID=A0A4P6JZK8_KTERU|nr:ABC transporter ATP-binding protein [Ktedonosporobacter rubrisoli]QBD81184.1 ABC transporter ATP-binding protein [Ktedonosporobacter rubrisoli]
MTYAIETDNLGKRYGKHWALQNCTLHIPLGSVTGLVGLNGAGKTTLMQMLAGLLEPTVGTLRVLDTVPSLEATGWLRRIGFVAQDHALYKHFSVREMLLLGRKLNPGWDNTLAQEALERLHIPTARRVGKLSGGQQTLLALVLALAKRPELLLLDEPFGNMDPLAQQEFMKMLMEAVVNHHVTVLLSSHRTQDLEQICDYLVILASANVQVAGEVESLLNTHKRLIGPEADFASLAKTHKVIQASHAGRQSQAVVKLNGSVNNPDWEFEDISLADLILVYLSLQVAEQAIPELQEVHK